MNNAPNEQQQTWQAERYRERAGYVAAHGAGVVDLLAPRAGERVLDVGCGDGTLTMKIVEAGAHVVGIDQSAEQVEAATALGLDARVGDVLALDEQDAFDAVFSSAVLHWVQSPDLAAGNIFKAIKPGGRFVGEFGGAGNVQRVSDAILLALGERGVDGMMAWPWYFPTDAEYRDVLERAGFEVQEIMLFERPTPLPGGIGEWVEILAQPFLTLVSDDDRPGLLESIERHAEPWLCDEAGQWHADYVRLRFAAHKPEVND